MEQYHREELPKKTPKKTPLTGDQPDILGLVLNGPEYIKNTLSANIPQGAEFQYLHGYVQDLMDGYGHNEEYCKKLSEAVKNIKQTYDRSFDKANTIEQPKSAQNFLDYLQSLPGHENKTYYGARLKLLLIALSMPKTTFENPKKPSNLHIGKITMDTIHNIEDDDVYYARESAFNNGSQELCILFGDQNGNITPELLNIQTDAPTIYLKSKKSTH